MVVISLERFYVIHRPMGIKYIKMKTCMYIILVCVVLSLFWCVVPLFGWSRYSLEGAKTTCAVEWEERSFSVISYNVAIFIFVFFVPVCILFFTNIRLIFIVNKMNLRSNMIKTIKQKVEKKTRRVTIVLIIYMGKMCLLFSFSLKKKLVILILFIFYVFV